MFEYDICHASSVDVHSMDYRLFLSEIVLLKGHLLPNAGELNRVVKNVALYLAWLM